MHEVRPAVTASDRTNQLLWVYQPPRRRYGAPARSVTGKSAAKPVASKSAAGASSPGKCAPGRAAGKSAPAKSSPSNAEQNGLHLADLEQRQDYQRLLARLVRLGERFQRSLTAEQRQNWLALEDALLDHAWFLHGYYLKAGYELGKSAAQNASRAQRRTSGERPGGTGGDLREQVALLSAFARLLETLTDVRR